MATLTTVDTWRDFLLGVRRDMLHAHIQYVLHEPLAPEIRNAPASYVEDVYGWEPVQSLLGFYDALVQPRVQGMHLFAKKTRYERLRSLEQDSAWITQTAGSIRHLGWQLRNSLPAKPDVNDRRGLFLRDLPAVQRRLSTTITSLMLMLSQIEESAETIAADAVWRDAGPRSTYQVQIGDKLLEAVPTYYRQWLPQYEELLREGY